MTGFRVDKQAIRTCMNRILGFYQEVVPQASPEKPIHNNLSHQNRTDTSGKQCKTTSRAACSTNKKSGSGNKSGGSTNKKKLAVTSSCKDASSMKKTAAYTASSHQDTITPDKVSSLPRNKLVNMVNKSTGEKGSIPTAAKRSTSGINQIS